MCWREKSEIREWMCEEGKGLDREERMYGKQREKNVGLGSRYPRVEASPCLITNRALDLPFRAMNAFSGRFLSS